MTARLQLALNVRDLTAAVDYYSQLFDTTPHKVHDGYANFAIANPPLKLVLFEQPDASNLLNHLGVEVFDDAEVATAATRLTAAGLTVATDPANHCCHAVQNKAVSHSPDGVMCEWYRVTDDAPVSVDAAAGCCT